MNTVTTLTPHRDDRLARVRLPVSLETHVSTLTRAELTDLEAVRGVPSGVPEIFPAQYLRSPASLMAVLGMLDVYSQILHATMSLPRRRSRPDIALDGHRGTRAEPGFHLSRTHHRLRLRSIMGVA